MNKRLLPSLTLLVVLTWLPWSLGCSGDKAASTKSKEEIRQEYIDRTDRMKKEMSK